MAFWLFILLQVLASAESRSADQMNQTDLQEAMADMRLRSYHGFVIFLRILNASPNPLPDSEITFLMPNDEHLSEAAINQDNLQDFILSHSIPTALLMSHLLHFPNGSLVPTGLPNRMLSITNNGRLGLFLNNARIVAPNVCLNSLIKCHGISATITFDPFQDAFRVRSTVNARPESKNPKIHNRVKSSPLMKQKKVPQLK